MTSDTPSASNTWARLLIFIGITVICLIVFTLMAFVIIAAVSDLSMAQIASEIENLTPGSEYRGVVKFSQLISSIGGFIVAPIIFLLTIRSNVFRTRIVPSEGELPQNDFRFWTSFNRKHLLITIISLPVIMPLLSYIAYHNFTQAAEWGYSSEKLLKTYEVMSYAADIPELLFNLVLMALIPAIGEELAFRGILQKLFKDLTKNRHIAVLITSLLFALIHFNISQVLGIFFIAVFLGYLMEYTQNLLFPIILHFLNNSVSVVFSYLENKNGANYEMMQNDYQPGNILVLISVLGTIFLFYYFNKNLRSNEQSLNS